MKNRQRESVQLDIKIEVTAEAIQKIWTWTDMAHGEVSALGLVEEIRNENAGAVKTLRITDFVLLEQICDEVETEMDPRSIAELMQLVEDPSRLRCWVHSHGTMEVFWSGTDSETIAGLSNGEWLLSLVVNKARQTMMRLDMFHPAHLFLEDVVWEVHYPAIEGLAEQCQKEFKEKVKEGFGLTNIIKSHHQPVTSRLGILPDELDEDLYWEGVDLDDIEELEVR